METGAPIVGADGVVRYIDSIATIVDKQKRVIGWLYLAQSADKGTQAEYAQGNDSMGASARTTLHLSSAQGGKTSIALLTGSLPPFLNVETCSGSPSKK
jgi:hypothetical protein